MSRSIKPVFKSQSSLFLTLASIYRNMAEKILLVEDNDMLQEILSARLSMKGFDVQIASNGLEAVEFAESFRPDVILMDMSLPFLSGWEATIEIRSKIATANIPIIALTAHAMITDREKGLDAGCNLYMTKPVDFAKLLTHIHDLITERKIEK